MKYNPYNILAAVLLIGTIIAVSSCSKEPCGPDKYSSGDVVVTKLGTIAYIKSVHKAHCGDNRPYYVEYESGKDGYIGDKFIFREIEVTEDKILEFRQNRDNKIDNEKTR